MVPNSHTQIDLYARRCLSRQVNLDVNKLSTQRRAQVISALVEGNSIRSTCRMTGTAKGTVMTLLAAGTACYDYQNKILCNLTCRRIQCDEIWSFCYAKEKNVPAEHQAQFGYGDVWTWTAIDADSKLVPSFLVGNRGAATANAFMLDLAGRLTHRVQLTTDGHKLYLEAVGGAFGTDIDYAILVKLYGESEKRYSPAECIGVEGRTITGNPDPAYISTSYAERQNVTIWMGTRRFTRLANAFSKKVENLEHAVLLHFMCYNFARPHKTLKGSTPAIAAGVTRHEWTITDIVELIESREGQNSY